MQGRKPLGCAPVRRHKRWVTAANGLQVWHATPWYTCATGTSVHQKPAMLPKLHLDRSRSTPRAPHLYLAAHVSHHVLQRAVDRPPLLLAHALELRQRVLLLQKPSEEGVPLRRQ